MNKLIEIVFLLMIMLLYACNDVNNNSLSHTTYYSPLNNGVAFFNFTDDSLFFYSSETNKKASYKTRYKNGKITINKSKIDILKNNNKIIFVDKKHFFTGKDTIVLNEIKLKEKNNKITITNKYWFKNFVKQDISQSIWYHFKEKNKVDVYLSNDNDISFYNHYYDIIRFGNHRIINMPFFFEKKSFLIKEITNNELILFTYNNFENSAFQIELSQYEKSKQPPSSLLYNEWVKIDSTNALELPSMLKINKNHIIVGGDTIFYELGLKNKYLLFDSGYKSLIGNVFITEINKLTGDTLVLERKSRLGKEIGVYKSISQ